jgi:hypothetical protein
MEDVMAKVESSVMISRPVEEVFRFFLDFDQNAATMEPNVESVAKSPGRAHKVRSLRQRLGTRRLTALVEEAIVDAYGESEQRVGCLTMLEEHLTCPFTTAIVGVPVRVERVDLNDADEIVAICRRGRERQIIPILNLPLPSPPPAGWEWIEAYRHWARGGR